MNTSNVSEIDQLINEIKTLKAQQKGETKNYLEVPRHQRDAHQSQAQQLIVPAEEVLSFIETTLKTLNDFKKHFTTPSDTRKTRLDM